MHANQECTWKSYWCHPTDQQARWVHFQQEWWKSVWGIDSKKKPFVFLRLAEEIHFKQDGKLNV